MATEEMKRLPKSTSKVPDLPAEQQQLFVEVLELLNQKQVPYVVSGAFALHQHTGISRDTKDLDLFLPAEHVQRALDALQEAGFETEVADPVWLAKAHRGDFFVDLITGMSNGIVTVNESDALRDAAMQRQRALQNRIDRVRLRTPTGVDSKYLARPLARQRRSHDEAVNVLPRQAAIGQRPPECERSVTVTILIRRAPAGPRVIFRVIGIANADNSDVVTQST